MLNPRPLRGTAQATKGIQDTDDLACVSAHGQADTAEAHARTSGRLRSLPRGPGTKEATAADIHLQRAGKPLVRFGVPPYPARSAERRTGGFRGRTEGFFGMSERQESPARDGAFSPINGRGF